MLAGSFESLRVFVKAEVSQMHVKIFNVCMIRFFIVVGAKSSETLIAEISFDGVHAADKNVQPAVKFLLV